MAQRNRKSNKRYVSGSPDSSTQIVTFADQRAEASYRHAVSTYNPDNKMYSAYLNESGSSNTLSTSYISQLGQDAQSNLSNIQAINTIIRQYVNTDDLIGMVVQSIQNNINTDLRLSYKNFNGARNKTKTLERA